MALGKKINTNGNIHWFFYPTNTFADLKNLTVTELNSVFDTANASNAISYNDTDFGAQASETNDDPSFAASGVSLTRGASQYGGGFSFYYPGEYDDATNSLSRFYDLMSQRSEWIVVLRNDGEKAWTDLWEEGDLYSSFHILIAGESQSIQGTDAFRYTVTALSQGSMNLYRVVTDSTGGLTVNIDGEPTSPSVDDKGVLAGSVTVDGTTRIYTHGLKWTSDDPDVVEVTRNGVWIAKGAGTAEITATYEPSGDSESVTITVS